MSKRTELKLEFLGISGVDPFIGNVSSSRAVMDSSHISSRPSLVTPDEPLIKTGIEYELGKYINDVRAEHDYTVKAIIPKYREYGINTTPVYTVFAEYEENNVVYLDVIEVDTYRFTHGFFGYELKLTDTFLSSSFNSTIPKDSILASANSLGENGEYRFGLNVNTAFMSHPSVSEDGFVVSESFVERAKFTSIVKRVININRDSIPLNLYGNDDVYKFFPNIGEDVRPDGLLCAIRQKNDWFSVTDLNNSALREVDSTFDTSVYVNPNSIVIDVNVVKGEFHKPEFTPTMTSQLDHYSEMLTNYYSNIVSKYEQLMQEKKVKYGNSEVIKLTPRMHRFITDTMIKLNIATSGKNRLCYRKLPIDQYRVEITTMSVIKPSIGFKLCGIFGDKGVICSILPDEKMPVDKLGNRADVIADSNASISRMIIGRDYQMYLASASRDNKHRLQKHYLSVFGSNYLKTITDEGLDHFRIYMRGFYELINPDMVEFIDSLNSDELYKHFLECMTKEIYIYYPPDNAINIVDVITGLENSIYKPHIGTVSFVNDLNQRVETRDNIRIGQSYVMVLEKIANDYSAVSSARINNFGFPVKGTNLDKHKYPHSLTPTKTLGETEVRIFTSYADPKAVADLFDYTLNPVTHKMLVKSILTGTKAFNPDFDVDRSVIEYGNTKSLAILRHIFNSAGFTYKFTP